MPQSGLPAPSDCEPLPGDVEPKQQPGSPWEAELSQQSSGSYVWKHLQLWDSDDGPTVVPPEARTRLPPPGFAPAFSEQARGTPEDWSWAEALPWSGRV